MPASGASSTAIRLAEPGEIICRASSATGRRMGLMCSEQIRSRRFGPGLPVAENRLRRMRTAEAAVVVSHPTPASATIRAIRKHLPMRSRPVRSSATVVLPMPPLVNRSRAPASVTLIGTAPDSELLVGIDGTGSLKWRETDPETQRATNSNVFNMVKDFESPHLYLVGPNTLGTDVRIISARALALIHAQLRENPNLAISLVGHSRGGSTGARLDVSPIACVRLLGCRTGRWPVEPSHLPGPPSASARRWV